METMKILLAAAVMAGSAGCGGLQVDQSKVVAPPEHAAEAIHAVAGFYKMGSVPQIYWYGGAALDCDSGRGFGTEENCWYGVYADGVAIVAAPLDGRFSEPLGDPPASVLAHELGHAASDQRGEGGDQTHVGHFFAPGGEVDQATAMLASEGL